MSALQWRLTCQPTRSGFEQQIPPIVPREVSKIATDIPKSKPSIISTTIGNNSTCNRCKLMSTGYLTTFPAYIHTNEVCSLCTQRSLLIILYTHHQIYPEHCTFSTKPVKRDAGKFRWFADGYVLLQRPYEDSARVTPFKLATSLTGRRCKSGQRAWASQQWRDLPLLMSDCCVCHIIIVYINAILCTSMKGKTKNGKNEENFTCTKCSGLDAWLSSARRSIFPEYFSAVVLTLPQDNALICFKYLLWTT